MVTGAYRRLGSAIARALAGAGATVWLHSRAPSPEATALLAELGPHGGGLLFADLASPADRSRLCQEAARQSGGIDIWINNAARFLPDSAAPGALAGQCAVNHDAPLAFLDFLAAARRPACVIHILDARIALPPSADAPFAAYAATKRDLAATIPSSARDLAHLGIRVNGIAPGDVLPPETHREKARPIPLPHRPVPDDIARAAVFIAGTPSLTGQILFLDSGLRLCP